VIATSGDNDPLGGIVSGIEPGLPDGGGVMAGVPVAEEAEPKGVVVVADAIEVSAAPLAPTVTPSAVIVDAPVGNGIVVSLSTIPEGPITIVDPSASVKVSSVEGIATAEPSMTTLESDALIKIEVGAGPMVSVLPSVVIVVKLVTDEPGCSVNTVVDPSGCVRVSTIEESVRLVDVGDGPRVNGLPSVVMVVNPVTEEPGGKVKTIVEPSAFVKVSTIDESDAPVDVATGARVSVDPSVKIVVAPVIDDPDGRVKVTEDPSGSVSVSTREPSGDAVSDDAGPSVKVVPSVVSVVRPVIVEPDSKVNVVDEPSGSVRV
jgi:hypothetical protein